MKNLLLFFGLIAGSCPVFAQTLIMNEVSQGVTNNMEYVEFVVIDTTVAYDCASGLPPSIDIRGWIFDDNSGYHGAAGIAAGCVRFSYDPLWSALPLGTIILIYNDADPELSLPPDDLSMIDGNCLIVAPISNTSLFESNATTPGAVACSYPAAGWTPGGNWSNTLLANGGDCARIVDTVGCEKFSVCWGTANVNTQIYFSGSAGNAVYYFNDVDPENQLNWSQGCTDNETILDLNQCGSNDQTPGAPNNAANAAYIAMFNNGCTPIPPLSGSGLVDNNEICACDGQATASGSGSIGPYTYTWYDVSFTPIGQSTPTAINLCTGDYNVIVESAIGCLDTALVTILPGSIPDVSPLAPLQDCDSVQLPAISGVNLTGSESYFDGTNGTGTQYFPGDWISSNVTLYAYDANGPCSDEEQLVITIHNTPIASFALSPASSCSIPHTVFFTDQSTLPDTWFWDFGDGNTSMAQNPIHNYNTYNTFTVTLTVLDTITGCADQTTGTVIVSQPPDITAIAPLTGCDSVQLNAIAGMNLSGSQGYYTGSMGTGTQLNPGDWVSANTTLYAYDVIGSCDDEEMFTVTVTTTPTMLVMDTTTCSPNTVDLTNTTYWSASSGSLNYFQDVGLTNPIVDPTQVGAGTYYIEADDNGCTNSAAVTIVVNTTPTMALQDTTFCAPNTVDLTNTSIWTADFGSLSYYQDAGLTNPIVDPTQVGNGTYYIEANNLGCTNSGMVTVTVNALPVIAVTGSNPNICNASDGSIEVTLSSGPLSTGTLTWSGTANGTNPGADITLDSPDISMLTAGNYDVTFTDANGCVSNTASVGLSNPNAPILDAIMPLTACDSVQLPTITGTGLTANLSYWTGMGATGGQLFAGDWIATTTTVYAYDSTNTNPSCWDEEPLSITINTTPILDPIADVTACGSYDLPIPIQGTNLTPNVAYYDDSQNNGGSAINGTLTATQTVYVFDDNNGCSDEVSFVVTIEEPDDASFALTDHCEGDANVATITGLQGGSFAFEQQPVDGATIDPSTGSVSNGTGGTTYGVVYTTNGNCPAASTEYVQVYPIPNPPTVTGDGVYCANSDIPLMTATGSGGTFTWFDDAGLTNNIGTGTSLAPGETIGVTLYYVDETSAQGCVGPASVITIEIEGCNIIIPTAFTPNSDTYHDNWEIVNLDLVYPNNVVMVYNRWGNLLFRHDSQSDGPYDQNRWDGTYNGQELPVASYYVIIEYNNQAMESYTGTVSIVKED